MLSPGTFKHFIHIKYNIKVTHTTRHTENTRLNNNLMTFIEFYVVAVKPF